MHSGGNLKEDSLRNWENKGEALEPYAFLLCPICCDYFAPPAVQCKWGHTFCDQCIQTWMKKKPSCPVCRKPISRTTICRNLVVEQAMSELDVPPSRAALKGFLMKDDGSRGIFWRVVFVLFCCNLLGVTGLFILCWHLGPNEAWSAANVLRDGRSLQAVNEYLMNSFQETMLLVWEKTVIIISFVGTVAIYVTYQLGSLFLHLLTKALVWWTKALWVIAILFLETALFIGDTLHHCIL